MAKPEEDKLLERFKNAYLNRNENKICLIRKELQSSHIAFDEKTIIDSVTPMHKLIDAAKALRQRGINRDSLEFDQLLQQAKPYRENHLTGLLYQEIDKSNLCNSENTVQEPIQEKYSLPALGGIKVEISEKLVKLLWILLWEDSCEKNTSLKLLKADLSCKYPEYDGHVKQIIQYVDYINPILHEIGLLAKNGISRDSKEVNDFLARIPDYDKSEIIKNNVAEKFADYKKNRDKANAIRNYGKPKITQQDSAQPCITKIPLIKSDSIELKRPPCELHHNDICNQKPSKKWQLFIDETGKEFSNTEGSIKKADLGHLAGVLIPLESKLPKITEQLHTTDCTDKQSMRRVDNAIEDILKHECAVIGITMKALPSGVDWAAGVGALIDLVLRLLPLDGKTVLDIKVERRGIFDSSSNFALIESDCRNRLMRVWPNRAQLINLTIACMGKSDPFNGYPDVVAHTWGRASRNDIAKNRLKQTQWKGSCLLEDDAQLLTNALNDFHAGINMSPQNWDNILASPEASLPNSLASAVLATLGEECSNSIDLWKNCLSHVNSHLDSKAVDLRKLSKQLNWLKKYQPVDAELPPRLKLLWLTSKLAEANHRGECHPESFAEYSGLAEILYDEDAPLVCKSDLNIAVSFTNDFQFVEARQSLSRWENVPCAIPGLKYYGQLLSSFGQHAAFLGDSELAVNYFDQAISSFNRLSEPVERSREISQTMAYRIIALMDAAKLTEADLETYFGKSFALASAGLAVSGDDGDKYAHHILVRYLAMHGGSSQKAHYLSRRQEWKTGFGHPWPLIQFYRAMIADDKAQAVELLKSGVELADGNGPVVKLIGTVILLALHYYQPQYADEITGRIVEAARDIPDYKGFDTLKAQLISPVPPLELIKKALPFNFR